MTRHYPLLVALGAVLAATLASPAPRAATMQPARIEGLTKPQFDALPPDASITVHGATMTKKAFLAQQSAARDRFVKLRDGLQAKAKADFASRRAAFLKKQQSELSAANAKLAAEAQKLKAEEARSPNYAALSKEGAALVAKSRNASPAERAQFDKRAQEILDALKRH